MTESRRLAWRSTILFVLGLIFTMMLVGANVLEAKRMAKEATPKQGNPVLIDNMNFGCKPPAMTPVQQSAKPEAHGKDKVEKGNKPPRMTPVPQTPPPSQPPPTPVPPKK